MPLSTPKGMSWIVGVIFAASLLWGGLASWRLWVAEKNESLVKIHLQRELVRQMGRSLQERVSALMRGIWSANAESPLLLARRVQRQLRGNDWIWHAVVLDAKGNMTWPYLAWEGRDDEAFLARSQSITCTSFRQLRPTSRVGQAALLAVAHSLLTKEPSCSLLPQLRVALLRDMHLQSRFERRWLYFASPKRALWLMAGPSHLLLLRLYKGKHVGLALPLGLQQHRLLPEAVRGRVDSVWLGPVSSKAVSHAEWHALSGPLAGYALYASAPKVGASSSRGLWGIVTISLILTWSALMALLVLIRKRALWEERRQALFAAITHELKTPVAGQLALLDTMRKLQPEVAKGEHFRALHGETRRLQQLLQNVLALHHDIPPREAFRRFDLTALTHQLIEELEGHAERREIDLMCEQRSPHWVQIEPVSVELALRNLLDNAIKYIPEGGWVRVDIEARGSDVFWYVRDSGDGIPAALREQVFVPFVRGESRRIPGSGLGLPLAHKLIAQQGGALTLLPGTRENGGFCARFPLDESK